MELIKHPASAFSIVYSQYNIYHLRLYLFGTTAFRELSKGVPVTDHDGNRIGESQVNIYIYDKLFTMVKY